MLINKVIHKMREICHVAVLLCKSYGKKPRAARMSLCSVETWAQQPWKSDWWRPRSSRAKLWTGQEFWLTKVRAGETATRQWQCSRKPRNLDARQGPKRRQVNGRRLALAMRRIPAGAPVFRNTYQRGAVPLEWQQLRKLSGESPKFKACLSHRVSSRAS